MRANDNCVDDDGSDEGAPVELTLREYHIVLWEQRFDGTTRRKTIVITTSHEIKSIVVVDSDVPLPSDPLDVRSDADSINP
jgi:hypothetical protein